jgi:hypothetical protein
MVIPLLAGVKHLGLSSPAHAARNVHAGCARERARPARGSTPRRQGRVRQVGRERVLERIPTGPAAHPPRQERARPVRAEAHPKNGAPE